MMVSRPAGAPLGPEPPDPRLILAEDELDRTLETLIMAETTVWETVDRALADGALGRAHFRTAFLLKQRPGVGVQELARLTGMSKQAASRLVKELVDAGLASTEPGALDGRRRPARLTDAGVRFEAAVSAALREVLASAYRQGGLDAAPGAIRILAALAGARAPRRSREEL